MAKKKVTATLAEQGGASEAPDFEKDLPIIIHMQALLVELTGLQSSLAETQGNVGLTSDLQKLISALNITERLRHEISARANSPEHLAELLAAVSRLVVDSNQMLAVGGNISLAIECLEKDLANFSAFNLRFHELCSINTEKQLSFSALRDTSVAIQQKQLRLQVWCSWRRVRGEAIQRNLMPLVKIIEAGELSEKKAEQIFDVAYSRWFAASAIDSEPQLRSFVSAEHMSDIQNYRILDDELSKLCVRYIRAKLCGLIPSKNEISKRDGFGILKHELQKQRRHKPFRQLAIEMGDAMTRLAPCMLMSPLSIAQYLPADLELFDLVIFDEASQIAPWDAIGSIARGKQVVIAGVRPGDRVGIRIPSGSRDLYVSILATLVAGAAYVPVDADDPEERARLVFGEARVVGTIGAGGVFTPREGVDAVALADRDLDVFVPGAAAPDDDAWVIFTSGSTGVPKGVAVTHRSAAAFVDAEANLFLQGEPIGPGDRVLAGLSVAFDASCEEMWLAWRNGAALVPAPRSLVRSGVDLGPWLIAHGITVVSTVPTLAALWPEEALESVRLVIFGGEACPPELAARIVARGREVWNTYGPTEATVVSCASLLTGGGPIRIGLPLEGWDLAVVDGTGNPVREGEIGELIIGGVGLARYLDPAKHAEKFAPMMTLGWQRAYRSGDIVRFEREGLVFVGRADDQRSYSALPLATRCSSATWRWRTPYPPSTGKPPTPRCVSCSPQEMCR